jgi:hypothetical protein
LVELASFLSWKKYQIDLIKMWQEKIDIFIKDNCGYHEDFPNFFSNFNLTPSSFDSRGNKVFPNIPCPKVQFRGQRPYFQPIYGKRFGINLNCNFDDLDWLSSDDREGEWAVAFYSNKMFEPYEIFQGNISCNLEHLMIRRYDKITSSQNEVNQVSQQDKKSIYFSPLFSVALREARQCTIGNVIYRLIFQCRVKSSSIKFIRDPVEWVVDDPQSIRPYGIIFFTEE